MKTDRLLDILISLRMRDKLDSTLHNDKAYQQALKEQDMALKKMEKLKLGKKQSRIIDDVLSANNHYGAMYAFGAYRLGMQDGVKLMTELKEMEKEQ